MVNDDLDKLISQLNKIRKHLNNINKTISEVVDSQPYELERQLIEMKKVVMSPPFSALLAQTPLYKDIIDYCEQEQQKINKIKEEFHFGLGTKLKERFLTLGEIKGQLPVLRIKFYTIRFDFSNGDAVIWWGPEKEVIKKVALEPEIIFLTIKSFDENLTKMWNKPDDFYSILKQAYDRCLKLADTQAGEKINLLDLLSECVMLMQGKSFRIDPTKTHFTEYSRIQFSYDLYRIKTSTLTSNFQLSVAPFSVTEDRTKSLWVPDNEVGDGTYYQSIAFK